MTNVVKEAIVVPSTIQRRAGIAMGDRVEFKAIRGVITIVTKPPVADDEYTPEQRRIIDARLDEAEKGRTYGPFTAAEATRFLKAELKARSKTLKKTR